MSTDERKTGFGQRNEFGGRGGRGRGRGRGGRGRGGRREGPRGRGGDDGAKEWVPVTKLGRLVKEGKITSLEQIFQHSLPIKEYQIVDEFLKDKLKDEVMKISPVQKQSAAGQKTRFKAVVVVGDEAGHCGVGIKVAAEVASAIRGAIILAKLSIVPVRKGYWGTKLGEPHTVPVKVTGKCGSVRVRLIPAPRGTGIVAAPVPKKLLQFAGIQDVFTGTKGHTKTLQNFVRATFEAVAKTYQYLTPDLWPETKFTKTPYQEWSDLLAESKVKQIEERTEERPERSERRGRGRGRRY